MTHRQPGRPGITGQKVLLALLAAVLAWPAGALAKARKVDDYHWTGVDRIIAVGDIHGDYDQFMKVMKSAGLVDDKGRWAGGETHLVQTGDIPDRGPDTRKIFEYLERLQKEAARKGGYVHMLIGNHEAMNMYGDLRYTTPGEYAAFEGPNSVRYREAQWQHHLDVLKAQDPDAFAEMDLDAFRKKWEQQYPLGWVEQRIAWRPDGEIGKWVIEEPVAIEIDGNLFMHGGFSAKYCKDSLADITDTIHQGMANYDYQNPGMVEDELGPLWYRGLATDSETERAAMVEAILARYQAKRMVVGHTPTQGIVWPRFDARVILNDVGLSKYYGGYDAFLEITPDSVVAHYGDHEIPVPQGDDGRIEYLRQVIALNPGNAYLQSRLQKMLMASQGESGDAAAKTQEEPAAKPAAEMTEAEKEAAARAAQQEAWLSPDNCR